MKHYEYEISLFVEDELPEDKKEKLLSHLRNCDKCRRMLQDYENIKNNITQFYKALPEPGNEIKFGETRSNRSSLKRGTRKYIIPVSITVLVIFLLFLLIRINLWQPKVNSVSAVKKQLVPSDYDNFSTFNRVINKAIESRKLKTMQSELWLGGAYNQQLEFNEVINSALYSNYND